MTPDEIKITNEIADYINRNGGSAASWYVGIATSPKDRLFCDHCVKENQDVWIYRLAASEFSARRIEKFFLDQGTQGGPCGGSASTRYVYAYKISATTSEAA